MSGSGGNGSAVGVAGAGAAADAGATADAGAGAVGAAGAGIGATDDGAGADGEAAAERAGAAGAAIGEAEDVGAVEAAEALAAPFIWRSENANGAPAACCNARASSCCTSGFCTTRKANSLSAGNSMTSDEDAGSKTAFVVRNSAP